MILHPIVLFFHSLNYPCTWQWSLQGMLQGTSRNSVCDCLLGKEGCHPSEDCWIPGLNWHRWYRALQPPKYHHGPCSWSNQYAFRNPHALMQLNIIHWGVSEKQNLFLPVLQTKKSEVKVLEDWHFVRAHVLVSRWVPHARTSHGRMQKQALPWVLVIRTQVWGSRPLPETSPPPKGPTSLKHLFGD